MQLYAQNENEELVVASEAHKEHIYRCPECQERVKIRGGPHRQIHFYHLRSSLHCRQHKKGLPHLQTQLFLQRLLPQGEGKIERAFPEIARIADVAWEKKKILFEVQNSPISQEEVAARCADYESLGWQVIWILHEYRFNRKKRTQAEAFLYTRPCYFTNMDAQGQGMIYDQFEISRGGKRMYRGHPLKLDASAPQSLFAFAPTFDELQTISERFATRKIYFKGDVLDRLLNSSPHSSLWLELKKREKFYLPSSKKTLFSFLGSLKRGYQILFETLLETIG